MKRHINICIRIEDTIGKIYRKMAESAGLSAQARQVLLGLAEEEEDHAGQLRFALRFPEDLVVKSLPAMMNQAQQLLEEAQIIFENAELNQVNDQQAIRIGIELEKKFCQAHIANSFEFSDDSLKKMFAAMAKADELHCQRLLDLQKTLAHP
jgi:rubrerythrin